MAKYGLGRPPLGFCPSGLTCAEYHVSNMQAVELLDQKQEGLIRLEALQQQLPQLRALSSINSQEDVHECAMLSSMYRHYSPDKDLPFHLLPVLLHDSGIPTYVKGSSPEKQVLPRCSSNDMFCGHYYCAPASLLFAAGTNTQ